MTLKSLILVPFLATPALAGSLEPTPVEPAPVAPLAPVASPVTGDWTGPSVGAQLGYGSVDTDGAGDDSEDGMVYGLRAFYDHDFGNWVAGAGVQYDATDIDLGDAGDLDGIAKVGGRVGYDLGRTMVYGTGGYAHATTDGGSLDAGSSGGYYVGAGVETFVSDNVTLNGEVNYNEFSDFDDDDLEVDATTATVGINYRF
ncbi:porin family protein [Salipiger sp. HF18]|uniref:outer membrane protein n=1 Tax=Salipiger sp. HF18 TaxID=2721557 RepID=UPI00142D6011|nr:outer membrane beta-barrel protein [Salipiger sp. HF18]NIY98954.1 porin family protein [Salipiger sp. HF18]